MQYGVMRFKFGSIEYFVHDEGESAAWTDDWESAAEFIDLGEALEKAKEHGDGVYFVQSRED